MIAHLQFHLKIITELYLSVSDNMQQKMKKKIISERPLFSPSDNVNVNLSC